MTTEAQALDVPFWTRALLNGGGASPAIDGWKGHLWLPLNGIGSIRRVDRGGYCLLSYRVENAVGLGADAFEQACFRIYRHMATILGAQKAGHAVRLWNHIPSILEPLGELEHRYMVFNGGRLRAMEEWLGLGELATRVATASGVGHFGRDLLIHCLASEDTGVPVENPRQVPAYRYSARYGPRPPCFARATRLDRAGGASWLLVGGTASVRGEDSRYRGDLEGQLVETLLNLAEVVRAGESRGPIGEAPPTVTGPCEGRSAPTLTPDVGRWLASFRQLRIYHVEATDRARIRAYLERQMPSAADLEFQHADLCRPELLVEIEGVAELAAGAQPMAVSR